MCNEGILTDMWAEAFDMLQKGERPSHEFDWFAADSIGQIACFITAGVALIPKVIFRDKEMCWKLYNYFYEEPQDEIVFTKTYTLMDYDISHYERRGVYVYSNPVNIFKPYELIKSPKVPSNLKELPDEIKEWLKPQTFTDLEFSNSSKIDTSQYFECI
jgi:hypothetical protein